MSRWQWPSQFHLWSTSVILIALRASSHLICRSILWNRYCWYPILQRRKPNIRLGNLFKVTELMSNRAEIQPQRADALNSHTVPTLGKVSGAPALRCPSLPSPFVGRRESLLFLPVWQPVPLLLLTAPQFFFGEPHPQVPWGWVGSHPSLIQWWTCDPGWGYEIITSTQPKCLVGSGPSETHSARASSWDKVSRSQRGNLSYQGSMVSAVPSPPSSNDFLAWTLSATSLYLRDLILYVEYLFVEILVVHLLEKLLQKASRRSEIFIAI